MTYVADTPDRSRLWQIQTPAEVFVMPWLLEAYRKRKRHGGHNRQMMLWWLKNIPVIPIKTIKGDYRRIMQEHTPEDLVNAEAFLDNL